MSSALAIHSHRECLLLAPTLGPPALLPVPGGHRNPALHCSKRDWALFKLPVGCGELQARVSPALASLTQTLLTEQHFHAWHFVSLDHL